MVGAGHGGDGRRARSRGMRVFRPLPGRGLVPTDAHVLVLAAQFRVPVAVGIEVLAAHGVMDAVLETRCLSGTS